MTSTRSQAAIQALAVRVHEILGDLVALSADAQQQREQLQRRFVVALAELDAASGG